ncbi:hypothetical protein ACIGNX_26375 [Actinosynnema sp. NPDC053489]|uniref:hypothetical protein n=1 Tax=Actinosynnema sp. NPDC053489 TaxID=3363916 RepID=UPI0037CC6849
MVAVPVKLTWPQRLALALGAVLLGWGVLGFVGDRPQLAVLHLVTGAVLGAAALRTRVARLVGSLMGVVYLVVFAFGVGEPGGALDLGVVGNGAHLLVGFASVAVAQSCAWCEQRTRRHPARRRAARPW